MIGPYHRAIVQHDWRGLNEGAGSQDIGGYARSFELNCENGRLRIQRSLGGTVRPEAQHRVHAGRNIDNAPPTGFEHTGHERCNEGVRGHAIYLQEIPVELDAERPLPRTEEHTSELQSLMRISYAVFCLKKKNTKNKKK